MKEMSALYIYVKNDLKSIRKMLWRIIFANKLLMMMMMMIVGTQLPYVYTISKFFVFKQSILFF